MRTLLSSYSYSCSSSILQDLAQSEHYVSVCVWGALQFSESSNMVLVLYDIVYLLVNIH